MDEAIAAGAEKVSFSKSLIAYTENFLGFPTGMDVPVGFYDRSRSQWIPSEDGRVVGILSISGGLADLDIDGSGTAASAEALTVMGITDDERAELSQLYQAGESFWRVEIDHFTPYDFNWPPGLPDGAVAPELGGAEFPTDIDESCLGQGSIIECQNQTLGESIPIAGTPFSLNYRSDRVQGRGANYRVTVPLSDSSIPAVLKRIEVRADIAGQTFRQSFAPATNLSHTFTWDGKDAYGRKVQGGQWFSAEVAYVYDGVYRVPAPVAASFGFPSQSATGTIPSRREFTLSQVFSSRVETESLGGFDAKAAGFGGWSLGMHHFYDPQAKVLYLGDGSRRSSYSVGKRLVPYRVDSVEAMLGHVGDMELAADGSMVYVDTRNHKVVVVGPDGKLVKTYGYQRCDFWPVNCGPTAQNEVNFRYPGGVDIAPDGTIYVADSGDHRIIRIAPDGKVTELAASTKVWVSHGAGYWACNGEVTCWPSDVEVATDGSVYVADRDQYRIIRIGPDNVVSVVAGGGSDTGNSGLATSAQLNKPQKLAFGPDGSLYFTEGGPGSGIPFRVRRVTSDGRISTVAGGGSQSFSEGAPATSVALGRTRGIEVDDDGTVYFTEGGEGSFSGADARIRRVSTDGHMTTLAGGGPLAPTQGGSPTNSQLSSAASLVKHPDGSLLAACCAPYGDDSVNPGYGQNGAMYKIDDALPASASSELNIVSSDGAEVYVFSGQGRHLRTLDALTGQSLLTFGYDSAGLLISITDSDSNQVTIERDVSGNPTAVVSPFGKRSELTLNPDGYLASLENPESEITSFSYGQGGLLTSLTDAKNNLYEFTYDTQGRLELDEDPVGGSSALSRSNIANGIESTLTTALGRQTTYTVEEQTNGNERRLVEDPSGAISETITKADGSLKVTGTDGTVTTYEYAPDPRFGTQSPITSSLSIKTPSGLTSTTTRARTVQLSDPFDAFSLVSSVDTTTVNGRSFTSAYDAATKTFSSTTPEGRTSQLVTDAVGRPVTRKTPGLTDVSYVYDARGRLAQVSQGDRTWTYFYATNGDLQSIEDPLGRVVSFTFDGAGRLLHTQLPGSRDASYAYDDNGNLISATPPGGSAHSQDHTAVDLLKDYTAPVVGSASGTTQYTYNLDRQLTTSSRPGGRNLQFDYDTAGRIQAVKQGQVTLLSYSYDPVTGNLSSLGDAAGGTISYTYDGGLKTAITRSGAGAGTVSLNYNSDFAVTSEKINGGSEVVFAYDDDGFLEKAGDLTFTRAPDNGLLTSTTLQSSPTGPVTDTSYSYNSFGELGSFNADYEGSSLFDVDFAFDDLGRVTSRTETLGSTTTDFDYGYDAAGRLETVRGDGTLVATYGYDSNGNRTSLVTPTGNLTGLFDAQDRLMSYGDFGYTYLPSGELESKTHVPSNVTTNYEYDLLGNLASVTTPTTQIEYVVDGLNRRVTRSVDGATTHRFLYGNGAYPLAEVNATGEVVTRFVYAGLISSPEYMIRSGEVYRFVKDSLGSPRLVVRLSTGEIVQRLDYDEFGRVVTDTNPGFQPFGYAGGLYDPDTGLVRFGARDYDPYTGRFTAKDPLSLAAGLNVYAYAENDPINQLDPLGLDALENIGNFFAGWGDTATTIPFTNFSLTNWVRDKLGVNGVVDKCSAFYTGGQVTGFANVAAIGAAGAARSLGGKLGSVSDEGGSLLSRGRYVLSSEQGGSGPFLRHTGPDMMNLIRALRTTAKIPGGPFKPWMKPAGAAVLTALVYCQISGDC